MNAKDLVRRLIVHAPPDLLDDIYGRIRQGKGADDQRVAWEHIVGRARTIGIFSPEEVHIFLQFVRARSSSG